jgi:hypothetical protein
VSEASPANGNGTKWWGTYAPIAAAVFVVGGSIITFFVQIGTLSFQVAQISDRQSTIERRLSQLETKANNSQVDRAQIRSDLREVETQFCEGDNVRNLMHANDMRIQAMLWGKAFGSPLPTDNAFYPFVCQRLQERN